MENKSVYNEERFDSFFNKTIILSSKRYYKKQMKIIGKERTVVDDENFSALLQGVSMINSAFSTIDDIENTLELNSALKSLSAIEQSVIFLLFKEDLSQEDAAKILEICSKSVSRIKLRAITKLKRYINGTTKRLGKVFQQDNDKIMFSVENVIFQNELNPSLQDNSLNMITNVFLEVLKNLSPTLQITNDSIQQFSNILSNTSNTTNSIIQSDSITDNTTIIKFTDVCVNWLKSLLERTKKDPEDEDYLSPNTLDNYNTVLRDHTFPYLEDNPLYDNILLFSETNVDEILNRTNCRNTKRILLMTLRMVLAFAKGNSHITENPIVNKKLKRKRSEKKDYDFIEEDQRAIWINCMLKEIHSKEFKDSDSALAFLCTLLHGDRPEETCGTKWKDFNFKENDYHIQNAYKKLPICDKQTMKRIGWEHGDGPLKTTENDRHLSLDSLFKQLLLEHRIKQIYEYRKAGKKWSTNEYVFHNSSRTPFTPDVLSKNFSRFIKRNNLPQMVIYGLRHSFATHCRNLGVKSEILAKLMGHSEYETTQKYYIHISAKQKREALQKVQEQDLQQYLGDENKNLVHLQSKVSVYNKEVSNLKEVQNEDLTYYLQLNDDTLNALKDLILKINNKQKVSIS